MYLGLPPFGVTVEAERTFDGITFPSRVRAGWWWGTTGRKRTSSSGPRSPAPSVPPVRGDGGRTPVDLTVRYRAIPNTGPPPL